MAEEGTGRLDAAAEQGRNAAAARGNTAGRQPLVAVPEGNAAAVNENAPGWQPLVAVPQGNAAAVNDNAPENENAPERQPLVAVAAGVAAAPVAVMVPINVVIRPGLVQPRFDVEAALVGPTPRKSNMNCKILDRIDSDGL